MGTSLILGLVAAAIAGGTQIAAGVQESEAMSEAQRESRNLASQNRSDVLFANYMNQQGQDLNRALSRENLQFQQKEARQGRLERSQVRKQETKQRGIDRATNMFTGQAQLKNNILGLWSNIGGNNA